MPKTPTPAGFTVFQPRVIPGREQEAWTKIPTKHGLLEDVVRKVGSVTIDNWKPGQVGVIAHRGYANRDDKDKPPVHECSDAALEACIHIGVRTAETDTTPTMHGKAVLFHDQFLDRWTASSGPVGSTPLTTGIKYVDRSLDTDKLTIGPVTETTNQGLLFLKDAVEKLVTEHKPLTLLLDCRDGAAPKVAAEISRFPLEWRGRLIVQIQNFYPGGAGEFIAEVETLKPGKDWKETLRFAPSANPEGYDRRILGAKLSFENGVEPNFAWLKGFALKLNVAAFIIRRTHAAEDFDSGDSKFLIAPKQVKNEIDEVAFARDRIARELQSRCRAAFPKKPIISPAPFADVIAGGRFFIVTWEDPTKLRELLPEHNAKDYYTVAVANPKVHLDCKVDFIMADNIPWAAYEIAARQRML